MRKRKKNAPFIMYLLTHAMFMYILLFDCFNSCKNKLTKENTDTAGNDERKNTWVN